MTTTSPASAVTAAGEQSDSLNTKHMRRILASSFMGSAIEFYDFMLYATAASIVFNQVFFAGLGPQFAVFASFGTLVAGYLARPLGGVVFGHFGDRLGRKKVLIVSMVTMGLVSTAIGLLPTTAQAGITAPVLLVVFRVVQGIAVGGEWGGAMLMAVEHAPNRKRGFAASFANMGGPAGALLATLAMSLASLLPEGQFLAWGWRIPFLFSIVLVLIGLLIRLRVAETPLFRHLERAAEVKRLPIVEVISRYPKNLLLGLIAGAAGYSCQGLMTVWAVSRAIESGLDKTAVLNIKAGSAFVMVVCVVIAARLSDRYGRRTIMLSGAALGAVLAFPILYLIDSGTLWGFAIAMVLGAAIIQGVIYGPFGAFTAELFPTRTRYTGASLVYQGASTVGAGFTPAIASALLIAAGGSSWLVGGVWVVAFLAGAAAVLATREGRRQDLAAIH